MPKFWLPYYLFKEMEDWATASYPLETGGILIGYIADNTDIVVTFLIGPGPTAKHHRYAFEPDSVYQIELLHSHYYASKGKETYLGDWHSHPDGVSELSRRDKKTLASIARNPSSRNSNPVMAIISGSENSWSLGAVQFLAQEKRFFMTSYSIADLVLKII